MLKYSLVLAREGRVFVLFPAIIPRPGDQAWHRINDKLMLNG